MIYNNVIEVSHIYFVSVTNSQLGDILLYSVIKDKNKCNENVSKTSMYNLPIIYKRMWNGNVTQSNATQR